MKNLILFCIGVLIILIICIFLAYFIPKVVAFAVAVIATIILVEGIDNINKSL